MTSLKTWSRIIIGKTFIPCNVKMPNKFPYFKYDIWTRDPIFDQNYVQWWSYECGYLLQKSFLMKFSFKGKNPILTSESINFWALNFWTSHYWILLKFWVMWFQIPNRSLAMSLTVFIIMETSTDRFQSGRSRSLRFREP